ncbi:hypothetical protein Nepgr_022640 [Nepenthes gracilis]|uniref:Uncharacterized protein n=1 Tax=Nepenthes gracilis TaxID=150966 RepID=A0AAD3T0N8_NEPGR|nr:hypothetical protein Nepgr_022640 [Nepenthes gracilis]
MLDSFAVAAAAPRPANASGVPISVDLQSIPTGSVVEEREDPPVDCQVKKKNSPAVFSYRQIAGFSACSQARTIDGIGGRNGKDLGLG